MGDVPASVDGSAPGRRRKIPRRKDEPLNTAVQPLGAGVRARHPATGLRKIASEIPAPEAVKVILHSLDESKAEDTLSIDITGKSPLGDFMVVASGRSHRHVGAIADRLVSDLKDAGLPTPRVEGVPHCDWVLIDAGDVIVHVFRPEVRSFYNLEKMWTAEHLNGPTPV